VTITELAITETPHHLDCRRTVEGHGFSRANRTSNSIHAPSLP